MDIMRKRISLLLSIVMLGLAILPVLPAKVVNAAECQVAMTVKMGSTVMEHGGEYLVKGGEKVTVKASSSQADIAFIGYRYTEYASDPSPITDIEKSEITITLPTKAAGTKMYLSIEAVAANDNGQPNTITKTGWKNYLLVYEDSATPANGKVTVKADNKVVNPGSTTVVSAGSPINMTATPADRFVELQYQLGDGSIQTIRSTNTHTVYIPNDAKSGDQYTLKVKGYFDDDTSTAVDTYHFIVKGKDTTPTYTGDIVVKVNNVELQKDSTTKVKPGTEIIMSALPANHVTVLQFKLGSDGVETPIKNSSWTAKIPTDALPGEIYTLYVLANFDNGTTVGYEAYHFLVEAKTTPVPSKISGDIVVIVNDVELQAGSITDVLAGTPVNIKLLPQDKIKTMQYRLGDGQLNEISSSTKTVNIPENAQVGEIYVLAVNGILTDNSKISKADEIYKFRVSANPRHNDLLLEPWMEENEYIDQLSISLRNDSEVEEKANKNFYEINETVTYYIDYKNGGRKITVPVTIKLKLPLDFVIVDTDGGVVNGDTITWTFPNGLDEGEAGTLVCKIKYTSLKRLKDDANTIYPEASILQDGKVKDVSSVINFIFNSYDELIEIEHEPYMFGDEEKPTFRPDYIISRAEGALVLARIYGLDYRNIRNVSTKYTDLDQTYLEAQQAITAATEAGLINGYREDDGTYTFRPNGEMTKAEFIKILACMIQEMAEEEGIDGLEIKELENLVKVYDDTKKYYMVEGKRVYTHWALEEVTFLARLNMLPFLTADEPSFTLDEKITRAEVAQLVNSYLLRAPAEVTSKTYIQFVDVTRRHALIKDIVEATRDSHYFTVTPDVLEVEKKVR